jgi:uncharacterized protein (TIGR02284 family)
MVQLNKEVLDTLVELIEICKDGEIGYRNAAEKGRYPELMSIFNQYSRQRAEFINELRQVVERLGGSAENSDTAARAMHRGSMIMKSSVAEDPINVISACEKAEDDALRAYKEALNRPLPQEAKDIVQRHYMKVKEAHDRIRTFEIQAKNENIGSATEGAVD